MKTTLRTVLALGLLAATLALAGCHDGLYTGGFGYGYSGAAYTPPRPYYRSGYSYAYGRYGYSGYVPYGGHGHHGHHGHHSPYCD